MSGYRSNQRSIEIDTISIIGRIIGHWRRRWRRIIERLSVINENQDRISLTHTYTRTHRHQNPNRHLTYDHFVAVASSLALSHFHCNWLHFCHAYHHPSSIERTQCPFLFIILLTYHILFSQHIYSSYHIFNTKWWIWS